MGYDFHITRRENWVEEDPNCNDISLEEWLAYIGRNDSELVLSDAYWVNVPGEEGKSQVAPGCCEWTAHPQNELPCFDYYRGSVSTKNPDEPTIIKMIMMAKDLNAKVQGDDDEVYELSVNNEIVSRHIEPRLKDKKPWWKFW